MSLYLQCHCFLKEKQHLERFAKTKEKKKKEENTPTL